MKLLSVPTVITFMGYGIWIILPLYNVLSDDPIVNPITNFIIMVIGSAVAIFGMYLDRRADRKLKNNGKETLL